jgi:hypothetical protein
VFLKAFLRREVGVRGRAVAIPLDFSVRTNSDSILDKYIASNFEKEGRKGWEAAEYANTLLQDLQLGGTKGAKTEGSHRVI